MAERVGLRTLGSGDVVRLDGSLFRVLDVRLGATTGRIVARLVDASEREAYVFADTLEPLEGRWVERPRLPTCPHRRAGRTRRGLGGSRLLTLRADASALALTERTFYLHVRVPAEGSALVDLVDPAVLGPAVPAAVPGPACPVHLRELVLVGGGRNTRGRPFGPSWRCPVPRCDSIVWQGRT